MNPRLLSVALVASFLVVACAEPAPGPRPAPAEAINGSRKRVTAAIFSEPLTVAPAINGNSAGADALGLLVNSGLTVVDRRGGRIPRLAETMPSLEDGSWRIEPDGRMETTWRIRPGVTWHDGAPVTARDLGFTSEISRHGDAAELFDRRYQPIELVETPNPLTAVVRWSRPSIEADAIFDWLMAEHRLAESFAHSRSGFTTLEFWRSEFVGTGPFRVKEWAEGHHVALEANPAYLLGPPRIHELVVRFFRDSNALSGNLEAGAVEMTLGRGLLLGRTNHLEERWVDGRIERALGNSVHLWPQLQAPVPNLVGDARFRRALLHALDPDEIASSLALGVPRVTGVWIRPDAPEFVTVEREGVRYDYDPRRAMGLLEAVGLVRGADGSYHDGSGQKLALEVRTTDLVDIRSPDADDLLPTTMFRVADYWQRIGLAPEPTIVPRTRARDREYRARFRAFELVRGVVSPRTLKSQEVRTPQNRFAGGNAPGYADSQFDALVDRYSLTVPLAERLHLAGQIIRQLTEEVVVLPLFYDAEAIAIHHRIVGPAARHQHSNHAWNAHEWDVRAG